MPSGRRRVIGGVGVARILERPVGIEPNSPELGRLGAEPVSLDANTKKPRRVAAARLKKEGPSFRLSFGYLA